MKRVDREMLKNQPDYGDNRREPRASLMTLVEILWVDEAGTPRITSGKIEDKSPGGASIRIKEPIGVGSKLTVRWHRGQSSGTVRYCKPDHAEFVLGFQRDFAEPNAM